MSKKLRTPFRRYFGPQHRPFPAERCICGMQYSFYKVHRETGHHKRAMLEQRARLRMAGLMSSRGGQRGAAAESGAAA